MLDEGAVLAKFGKRMMNTNMMRAWNQWESVVLEIRRLRKFGARFANRACSLAFEQWYEAANGNRRLQKFARKWKSAGAPRILARASPTREHR